MISAIIEFERELKVKLKVKTEIIEIDNIPDKLDSSTLSEVERYIIKNTDEFTDISNLIDKQYDDIEGNHKFKIDDIEEIEIEDLGMCINKIF